MQLCVISRKIYYISFCNEDLHRDESTQPLHVPRHFALAIDDAIDESCEVFNETAETDPTFATLL